MRIEYDVTIEETETAFMMFWRKYNLRNTLLLTLIYSIAITLFVNMVLSGGILFGGLGAGLSAGMLMSCWYNPYRTRKKIVQALESADAENYSASFGERDIVVETVIAAEEFPAVEKSTYPLATEELYSKETNELFLLYVNRALIHVFPKRCLSEQEAEELRNYFIKKNI